MNIALLIALCILLLGLIIGFNVMSQQRQRTEAAKRQEMAKYIALIDSSEELIGNAHNLPYSGTLLACLNQRILDALRTMSELDEKDVNIKSRIASTEAQINDIKQSYQNKESTQFKVPDNDRQAIAMLKLVKRLRTVIKAEHGKGRLTTQAFVAENARLETMQLKINIENVIKRVNDAKVKGQLGTAQQLLKKALDVVSPKSDPYSTQVRQSLKEMYDDISAQLNQGHDSKAQAAEGEGDDYDELFAPKKKW
ncbi:DNA repair protein [Parasalinivibrio latis]|uniref:DNA repair protein n=1 Tax=Parasalinivibrio latis TaxID=2952610 RepID=UPI0030E4D88B